MIAIDSYRSKRYNERSLILLFFYKKKEVPNFNNKRGHLKVASTSQNPN